VERDPISQRRASQPVASGTASRMTAHVWTRAARIVHLLFTWEPPPRRIGDTEAPSRRPPGSPIQRTASPTYSRKSATSTKCARRTPTARRPASMATNWSRCWEVGPPALQQQDRAKLLERPAARPRVERPRTWQLLPHRGRRKFLFRKSYPRHPQTQQTTTSQSWNSPPPTPS